MRINKTSLLDHRVLPGPGSASESNRRRVEGIAGRPRACSSGGTASLTLLSILVALLAFGSASCGMQDPPAGAATQPESTRPGFFSVPENQLPRLQIQPVRSGTWRTTVHTTGTVDWDADHTTQAIAQVSGPITKILVGTGSAVKQGDPLLYVASPDITNAIAAYRKAKNRMDYQTRALERSRDLLEHRAISQKDLEGAEADYNDAATDLQDTLQALRIYGISAKQVADAEQQGVAIDPQLAVRAPISGTIVQMMVYPGQLIQAGATTCFSITDTSKVWVQGHVYEKDLDSVHVGDAVEERNAAFPEVFHGVVAYIGAMVDPSSRTTPVRIVTANPRGLLKKDLFVEAVVHTRTRRNVLVVPTSAVLFDPDNQPFVYVRVGENQFAKRMVTTGAQQDDTFEIAEGLKAGESVVTEGSVFLQFANTYQK